MNYKGLALISFILLILSLASVSASELDQTEVFESSIDDSIILDGPATDSSCDDSLAIDNDVPELQSEDGDGGIPIDTEDEDTSIETDDGPINSDINDDSIIINITNDTHKSKANDAPISNVNSDASSFEALQSLVDSVPKGTVLYLYNNYKATKDYQVLVNKDLIIDGLGHTIDCDGKCRAIHAPSGVCTLRNIKFINGYINGLSPSDSAYYGGAILIDGSAQYTIENCIFENNWADDYGGAISNQAKKLLTIINCTFKNNIADDMEGGAIYSEGTVHIIDSTFKGNQAYKYGGAISIDWSNQNQIINCLFESNSADSHSLGGAIILGSSNATIENSTFRSNSASLSGGAIYTTGKVLTIKNCLFESNRVEGGVGNYATGGAIHSSCADVYIDNSTFNRNYADDAGGAINMNLVSNKLYINANQSTSQGYTTVFSGNTADCYNGGAIHSEAHAYIWNTKFSSNNACTDGGAVDAENDCDFIHCLFESNCCKGASSQCEGGAIFSSGTANVDGCRFESNTAADYGGAIYAKNVNVGSKMYGRTYFNKNTASEDKGGAIYAENGVYAMDGIFNNNSANVDGGAICAKGDVKLNWCDFDSNRAEGAATTPCYGGAVCSNRVRADGCTFANNYAENHGGAIFTETFMADLSDCIFKNNKAKKDGGAVYINGKDIRTFLKCVFVNNHAGGKGGAIYLDSRSSDFYLLYNVFIGNSADDGYAVFNYGTYSIIKNNWWGNNNPTKDNNMLVEYHTFGSNENHVDSDPLWMVFGLQNNQVRVGETARLALFFWKSNNQIYEGEIPMDLDVALPDGVKVVSSTYNKNCIFLDIAADHAGNFEITGNNFGYTLPGCVFMVYDKAMSNGIANEGSHIVDEGYDIVVGDYDNDAIESVYPVFKSKLFELRSKTLTKIIFMVNDNLTSLNKTLLWLMRD